MVTIGGFSNGSPGDRCLVYRQRVVVGSLAPH